jgi:hypothetical protein
MPPARRASGTETGTRLAFLGLTPQARGISPARRALRTASVPLRRWTPPWWSGHEEPDSTALLRGGQGGSRAIPKRRHRGALRNPPVPPLRKGGSVRLRGAREIEPPRSARSADVAAAFQHASPGLLALPEQGQESDQTGPISSSSGSM